MKPLWRILIAGQLGNTLDAVKTSLGGFTAGIAQDLQQLLNNGLTFRDNMASAIVQFPAVHGTEMQVANPFDAPPIAFIPMNAMTLVGGVTGRNNGVQLQMAGPPIVNLSRTDLAPNGKPYLGLTVQYAPPAGVWVVRRAADQPVLNVTDTPISFDSVLSAASVASAIAHTNNTTDFTCLSTGIVAFEYSMLFDTNAVGYRQTSVRKGPAFSASEQYSNFFSSPAGGGGNYVTIAGIGTVPISVAGTVLRLYAWQNTGGSLNVTTAGDAGRNIATVRYIAPDPATTAMVTGILVSG